LHGEKIDQNARNVRWLHPEGREMTEGDWLVAGARAVALKLAARGGHRMLLLFNAGSEAVTFAIDETLEGFAWWEVLSTATGTVARNAIGVEREPPFTVEERSVTALVGRAR
jgi:pullulanase/glycogen debranching enzyme